MSYLKRHGTRRVPQWVPLPGQGPNSAGGFAWAVDDWTRLRRFLVLGSEGGSLLRVRVEADARERAGGGARASARTVCARSQRSSASRRGPRAEERPGALRARAGGRPRRRETRKAALEALPQVARTGTHLFQFAPFVEGFRGWGRSLRRAVGRWYAARPVDALAYQAVKYRQREGVTHRDLLRLAHPARRVGAGNPTLDVSDEHARLFEWIVRGGETDGLPRLVEGFARAQAAATPRESGGARPRVPACRARRCRAGAPDLARGLGGAARRHADDGADPQPGDDDAGRRPRAGLGRHGEGGRAARRRGAHPPGAGAPDRGARGAADVRVRPRRPRPAASGTRCARSSTRSTPRSTRRSATSSRRASGCCSRSTCRAR